MKTKIDVGRRRVHDPLKNTRDSGHRVRIHCVLQVAVMQSRRPVKHNGFWLGGQNPLNFSMDLDSRNVKTNIDQKNANNQFFPTSMMPPDMQGVRITWYTEAILLRRSKTIVFFNGTWPAKLCRDIIASYTKAILHRSSESIVFLNAPWPAR